MKHYALLVVFLILASFASAQDVIVKKDGSTILSKVLKVGETEVEYKKFKNQQGPTYTISVSNIQSINSESGDIDTFSSPDNAKDNNNETEAKEAYVPAPLTSETIAKNKSDIEEINSGTVNYIGKKNGKEAWKWILVLGVSPTSVIEDNNIKVSFEMIKKVTPSNLVGKIMTDKTFYEPVTDFCSYTSLDKKAFCLISDIENKTDRTIYIDLANCFSILDNEAEAFYVPTATQVTNSSSSGASVNVGAVAGALGVGGAIGTLARGVNVGGGSTSTTSNITYSQRVLSVPPKSKIELEAKFIGLGDRFAKNSWNYVNIFYKYFPSDMFVLNKKNQKELKEIILGEAIDFSEEKMSYPVSMSYSYSFSEDISNPQSVRIDLGVKRILGGGKSNMTTTSLKEKDFEFINNPLFIWLYLK